MLTIRASRKDDFTKLKEIYAYAREFMIAQGNPTQWGTEYPMDEMLLADVEDDNSYVIEQDGRVCGAFYFVIGDDPTYAQIDGAWPNDQPYGTIHRLAGDGTVTGLFETVLEFCESKIDNLRADTHEDNKLMQHLLEVHGFEKCGIIHVQHLDHTERIAYQKIVK